MWAIIVGGVAAIVTGIGITLAILWASRRGLATMLVMTLSLVTLVLLGIYAIFGEDRAEMIPLASAAIGALVATLTQQFAHAYQAKNAIKTEPEEEERALPVVSPLMSHHEVEEKPLPPADASGLTSEGSPSS
jgi:hypothetical protein